MLFVPPWKCVRIARGTIYTGHPFEVDGTNYNDCSANVYVASADKVSGGGVTVYYVPCGYHFVFSTPLVCHDNLAEQLLWPTTFDYATSGRTIDWSRLVLPVLAVVWVAAGVLFSLRRKE